MLRKLCISVCLFMASLRAQESGSQEKLLQEVLRRLDNLENQNRELMEQIKELRQHQAQNLPATVPPTEPKLEERVEVAEQRVAEQAQTKVESSQKLPVWLYGTLLFNAFANNRNPSTALGQYGLLSGPSPDGATVRQTMLGFGFQGPSLPGGGHVNGDIAMDFWAGASAPSSNWLRIRRAGISLDWTNTTIFAGQDKPLISPYEPNSLAEVGVPAMAGSGNLWFWLPQMRFQRIAHVSAKDGFDMQVAALQVASYSPFSAYSGGVRPAIEARLAFWHKTDEIKKFEIAPGFHLGSNLFSGKETISHIGSLDWLYKPYPRLDFRGAAYYGQNVASLGALGNGFYLNEYAVERPVISGGGWAQISVPVNNRITLNAFGGSENDQMEALYSSSNIAHTGSFAGNVVLHLSSNVLLSTEVQRLWTRTFAGISETYNHYDLALAYLF